MIVNLGRNLKHDSPLVRQVACIVIIAVKKLPSGDSMVYFPNIYRTTTRSLGLLSR